MLEGRDLASPLLAGRVASRGAGPWGRGERHPGDQAEVGPGTSGTLFPSGPRRRLRVPLGSEGGFPGPQSRLPRASGVGPGAGEVRSWARAHRVRYARLPRRRGTDADLAGTFDFVVPIFFSKSRPA